VSEGALTADNLVRIRGLSMDEVREFCLGILLHDLGKTMDLGYFEGNQAYDAARVKQHVLLGSGLFLRTYGQKYEEARYIIGDHHNYLFQADGYGLTRWDRSRGGRAAKKPQACVGATLESFQSGEALTFLPIEVCAVADVYDALTDPHRAYKKVREPKEAAQLMAEEFVAQGKMDPVIFDLFVGFLKAMGIDVPQLGFEERQASQTPWN
jgi:response regulator RpfG family c-di-GMP phosphodiesterase